MPGNVLAASLVGLGLHWFYFMHSEHHLHGSAIILCHAITLIALLSLNCATQGYLQGSFETSAQVGSYLFSLFSSIAIYRRFFHRLSTLPGPFLAGLTKLWHLSKSFSCKNHLLLDSLHREYGDIVRTGPNELTVFDPEIIWAIDGPNNRCSKPDWYDILWPIETVNTTRNKQNHADRRRAWDEALNVHAIAAYGDRFRLHVANMDNHIAVQTGRPIETTKLTSFLAFDIMGDVGFSKPFGMLNSNEWHYAIVLLHQALGLVAPFSPVPWLAQLTSKLTFVPEIRDWNRMLSWCNDRITEKMQARDTSEINIAMSLINYSKGRYRAINDLRWLQGDALAIIIAGSDTVASTLANILYRIALHPEHAELIRRELRPLKTPFDHQDLKRLDHLSGFINEVLRLHPPIPTGGYRKTPPEGLELAGQRIPGNIIIVAPRYTIGRLESLYKRPEEFVPERWYSRPDMVTNKKYFNPFGIGVYSCAGRTLALMELHYTVSLLLSRYMITFAPNEDGSKIQEDMKDQFTAVPGKLELVFTPL